MRFHCLQHVIFETPGLLSSWISQRGDSLRMSYLFETGVGSASLDDAGASAAHGDSGLPSLKDFDVLIVMGGPMSVHDEAVLPWLRSESV